MASDAQRHQARRLYIESEPDRRNLPPSDSAIGRACGIDRETVKRWREAEAWELARAEFHHRAASAAAHATSVERKAAKVLTALRRRELLESCAEDKAVPWPVRIQAMREDREEEREAREVASAAGTTAGAGVKTYTHVPEDASTWAQECEHERA